MLYVLDSKFERDQISFAKGRKAFDSRRKKDRIHDEGCETGNSG